MGRGGFDLPPYKIVGLKILWIVLFMLVKGHIPNLGPLGPLLHVKVCGGGGWVCKPILVIDLGPFSTRGP